MALWIMLFAFVAILALCFVLPVRYGLIALCIGMLGIGFVLGVLLHDWVSRPVDGYWLRK